MIEFNTSSLSLVDALTIGAIFAGLVILLTHYVARWYTSWELKVAEARVIVLRELLKEEEAKTSELQKQLNVQQWDQVHNVTKLYDR